MPDEERFWKSVDRRGDSECWPWMGTFNKKTGYGCLRIGSLTDGTRRQVDAHRYSCQIAHGPFKEKHQALHRCDNRACVNPNHLYPGTHADNMRDMRVRGRAAHNSYAGQENPRAKLTQEQVTDIRLSQDRPVTLARRYAVSITHIGYILTGKSWGHTLGADDLRRSQERGC